MATLLLQAVVFPQGSFLQKGQNGIGIYIDYNKNTIQSEFGGEVVYSRRGLIDFGISISNISFVEKAGGLVDVSALAVIPSVTWHFIKEDSLAIPFSSSIDVKYERDSYSSEALDEVGHSFDGNYVNAGASAYKDIVVSSEVGAQPTVRIGYQAGFRTLSDNQGGTLTLHDHSFLFDGEVTLLYRTSPVTRLRIVPGVRVDNLATTMLLKIGYLFAR